QEIIAYLSPRSRDNARTPMQWDTSTHAGFSSGQPWLKVNPNYKSINVKTELSDPDSVLNFYKKLIRLRKNESIFIYGKYQSVLEDHSQIYAYQRTTGTESALILCNLSESIAEFPQEAFFDY